MPILDNLDEERLSRYTRYQHIYRGRHERVFDLDGDDQFPTTRVNIPAAIIKGLAGLVAGKTPELTFSTQSAQVSWEDISEASAFGSELLQFVQQGLIFGDSVLKITRTDAGAVKVRCVSPALWHAIPDPDDNDEIQAHVLGYRRKAMGGDLQIFRAEIHTPGFIMNEVYRMSGGKITSQMSLAEAGKLFPEWVDLQEVVETGVDESLIVGWRHDRLCGEVYGTSEFKAIWDLIRTLDQRATQEDRVLTKHADPKLILEEGTIDRDENGNIVIKDSDVILVPQGSDKDQIGYITWDGKLEAVATQEKQLVEWMLHITQVSRLLMNADKTQAQTGLAVLAQMLPSIMKAEQIQKEIEASLRTAVRVAQKTAGQNPRNARIKTIEWGVKLPSDLQSTVQSEIMKLNAGVVSADEAKENLEGANKL